MPRIKLTERSIAKLAAPTPSGKQIAYWDSALRGFAVLVSGRTTVKSYIAQRDLKDGRTRRVTIANVNELSLAEAKDRACNCCWTCAMGRIRKRSQLLAPCRKRSTLYLQSSRLSPRSREIYAQLVRIQLAPLKDRALGSIRPEEIDAFHNRIAGKAVANSAIRCFGCCSIGPPAVTTAWAAIQFVSTKTNGIQLRPSDDPSLARTLGPSTARCDNYRRWCATIFFCCCSPACEEEKQPHCVGQRSILSGGLLGCQRRAPRPGSALDIPLTDYVRDLLVARRQLGDATFVFPG